MPIFIALEYYTIGAARPFRFEFGVNPVSRTIWIEQSQTVLKEFSFLFLFNIRCLNVFRLLFLSAAKSDQCRQTAAPIQRL
jgi:hypothetical protein